ncbi:S1 RNA-binding domain-containing protein [candidate division WWE3 bacterium]|nr:S1 RNA-binding domain-containing protein [candidate division WWE3 bacterium]
MSKARKIFKKDSVMNRLLGDSVIEVKQFAQGDVVEGIVVSVTAKEVLLDVGAKSEGVILSDEIGSDDYVKNLVPGTRALAYVVQAENDQGYIVLSFKRAQKERSWRDAEVSFKDDAILEVEVIEYNKGGLLVDCMGLRGFVPLSHLDRVHFTEDVGKFAAGSEAELKESLEVLSGKKLKVKVIEIDQEKNRLVLSEKDAVSTYSEDVRQERFESVKMGDLLNGVVTGVMPFGLFVDMEGLEGLVHISEIAWEKVSHPGNYFQVGSSIQVKVIGKDDISKKLALSVKQLMNNPWETAEAKYPVGTVVKGKVSKIVPFGAFVNLEKGLDGLIHVSEATRPLIDGEEVEATVTNVDGANQKLALSMRTAEK